MNIEFLNKWKSQVKRGTLTFIVLKELSGDKLYGYELIETIRERYKINIAEGTLYPLMNRMKSEGLVESNWEEQPSGIPRKYYQVTKAGVKILKQMINHWDELNSSLKT